MMERRILIGSCGGLTGSYLIRQYKERTEMSVWCADADAGNVSRHFADGFAYLPRATDPSFPKRLIELLNDQQIDYYLPTHSKEIRVVSQYEDMIRRSWGGNFIVSPYETFCQLDNKRTANENLARAGLPVAPVILPGTSDIEYPIFMKPDIGSGSRKSQVIETPGLHSEYARISPECSFYQYIRGTEYTVDCLFDDHGALLGYNQRIRVKNMGGAVIVTQNCYDFDILPFLQRIASAFTIKGCVNFQFILSEGVPYFTDVNLRYASGGLPLTVASGLDVPMLLIDILDRRPVGPVSSCGAEGRTMYRYFNEWYED